MSKNIILPVDAPKNWRANCMVLMEALIGVRSDRIPYRFSMLEEIRGRPGLSEPCEFIESIWDTLNHELDIHLLDHSVRFLFLQSHVPNGYENVIGEWRTFRDDLISALDRSHLEDWGLKYSIYQGSNLIRKPTSILSIKAGFRKHADALFQKVVQFSCTM